MPKAGIIVHIGLGNFHRAHLATYTATSNNFTKKPWGIIAYSKTNTLLVDAMNKQDNLYSVLEIGKFGEKVSIPAVHVKSLVGSANLQELADDLNSADTKIVSLTVTEAGYYLSPLTNSLDLTADEIKMDMEQGSSKTIYGILTQAIRWRILNNSGGFTVLSCDNINSNGDLTQRLLIEFVSQFEDHELLINFITDRMTFPNSMVDRIVPKATLEQRKLVNQILGLTDEIPVVTESFSMWALEDKFVSGRPAWDKSGVIFTQEVKKYENLKLRLLNGSHSLLAYLGALMGHHTIPESRFDPLIEKLVKKIIFDEYLPTVEVPAEINIHEYIEQLFDRWANVRLGDLVSRVGSDGSTKLPHRVTHPALEKIRKGEPPFLTSLTVAAWLACIAPFGDFAPGSQASLMADSNKQRILEILKKSKSPQDFVNNFFGETSIFQRNLSENKDFTHLVSNYYSSFVTRGGKNTLETFGDR